VSVPSSYQGGDNDRFSDKKISWVSSYADYLNGFDGKTKKAFIICDRDELPIGHIGNRKCDFVVKGIKHKFPKALIHTPILSWKRREIKHYLLSYTALSDDNVGDINEGLALTCQLSLGDSGDFKAAGKYNDQLAGVESELVKKIVGPHVNADGLGFCIEKAQAYINTIPREEISKDIVSMYSYLVSANE
jgi:hypothetical protein